MDYGVSVILPAYNEEKNISFVIEPLLGANLQQIICVNDGSTDRTRAELNKLESKAKNLKVISLEKNHGKAYAISQGLLAAEEEIVIFVDADIRGITEGAIKSLINPLINGTHDCVVGYPGDALDRLFKPISGERAYFRKDLLPLVDSLKNKGYALELYLNFSFRKKRIKSIVLPGVSHIMKHKKLPLLKAVKWYAYEIRELLSEIFFQDNPLWYFSNSYLHPFYFQEKIISILFVYDSISPIGGGSQVAAITWMENLKKQNIKVKLLCNKNAYQFVKNINPRDLIGLPYVNLNRIFPQYYPTLFLNNKIINEIKKFSPDIIHFHEPTIFAYQVMSFAKKNHVPAIFSFQTDFLKQTTAKIPLSFFTGKNGVVTRFFSGMQYKLCVKADIVLSLTRHYQKDLSSKLNKKVFLVMPPVKSAFFQQKKNQASMTKNLLAVGRLIQGKHMDVLIEMMKYLEDDFHLTLIGDGPDKSYICKLIKKLGLEKKITYKNWVNIEDLPREFLNAELYLSASDSETFGLTYISALASGTPCVVYDYKVSREVIPENAAIFINSLDPKVWADTIEKLLPRHYMELCQGIQDSYKRLKLYDEENSTKELIGIYKSLLRKNQA